MFPRKFSSNYQISEVKLSDIKKQKGAVSVLLLLFFPTPLFDLDSRAEIKENKVAKSEHLLSDVLVQKKEASTYVDEKSNAHLLVVTQPVMHKFGSQSLRFLKNPTPLIRLHASLPLPSKPGPHGSLFVIYRYGEFMLLPKDEK